MPPGCRALELHDVIAGRCPAVRLASRAPGGQNPSAPVIAVFKAVAVGSVAKVVNAMTVLTMALEAPEGSRAWKASRWPRDRMHHLVGVAALAAVGVVGRGGKIIGLPCAQPGHRVGGDIVDVHTGGIAAAGRTIMDFVARQIRLRVRIQARMTCSARAHTDIKTAINKVEKNSRLRDNFLDLEKFVFITAPSRDVWPATTRPF